MAGVVLQLRERKMTITPARARWMRVHHETFEQALHEAEQEQREMMALVLLLSPGELREAWEKKLLAMAKRLRRQREAWDRAVAEERNQD